MSNTFSSKAMIVAIKVYRYFFSPLFGQHCRFHPTCSAYAIEAIEQHGALRGASLAAMRLLRCQPLSEGGVDPVPMRMTSTKRAPSGGNSEQSLARDSR